MPELPEVEVVARTIRPEIQGKKIADVEVFWPRIVQFPDDQEQFKTQMIGESIGEIKRTGKYLIIEIGRYYEWVVHFRMTGKFIRMKRNQIDEKHTHLFFHFENDEEGLAYHDVRKFGDIFLVPKGEYSVIKGLSRAGIDPLSESCTYPIFQSLLQSRKRRVKALLLDQSVITGLGNYLCDELLWFHDQPGIHPERCTSTLSDDECYGMYVRMMEVIEKSIQSGGNSFRNFSYGNGMQGEFKSLLKVYGRKNEPCYNCETPIERIIVSGRSTHYCPRCQIKAD